MITFSSFLAHQLENADGTGPDCSFEKPSNSSMLAVDVAGLGVCLCSAFLDTSIYFSFYLGCMEKLPYSQVSTSSGYGSVCGGVVSFVMVVMVSVFASLRHFFNVFLF